MIDSMMRPAIKKGSEQFRTQCPLVVPYIAILYPPPPGKTPILNIRVIQAPALETPKPPPRLRNFETPKPRNPTRHLSQRLDPIISILEAASTAFLFGVFFLFGGGGGARRGGFRV